MSTLRSRCPVRLVRAMAAMTALAAALPAIAAPAVDAAAIDTPSVFSELLAIVIPLILIIAMLLAVLYFARRRFGLTGQDAPLSVLQILPVGPRERVVLVKARSGRVFVVGVGAQTVTFITDMQPEDLAPAEMSPSLRSTRTLDTSRPG